MRLAPLALALLVMLPRLASPQLGLLDDGLTVRTAREVAGRWAAVLDLIPDTGRFFPAYWLAWSALVGVVGARPLALFAVNTLLLAALLALLSRLVRLGGGARRETAVAAVVFAASGPTVETFYTLSKAESLQLAWIALALLAAAGAAGARAVAGRVALAGAATTALFAAYATKETTVALLPIFAGWLVVEHASAEPSARWRRFAVTCLAAAAVAGVAFIALRSQQATVALNEGWYTRAYRLDSAGPALIRIAAWLARDFAFLLPLAVVLRCGLRRGAAAHRPVLYAGIWMLGWLAVYVPWAATFEYYLLPFAFGAAVLAGTLAGVARAWRRPPAHAALAASAVLWLAATANAAADARVQLAVDQANADLVDFLGGLPPASRIVLNVSPVNEYHFELPMHLAEIRGRPDLRVEAIDRAQPWRPEPVVFLVTPEMAARPSPTVRVALHAPGVQHAAATLARLVADDGAERVYHRVERTALVEIALQRALCPLGLAAVDATSCPPGRGLLDRRTFAYGWQVHRLR
jgi:hypothetical protein